MSLHTTLTKPYAIPNDGALYKALPTTLPQLITAHESSSHAAIFVTKLKHFIEICINIIIKEYIQNK